MSLTLQGKTFVIPGAYAIINIINQGGNVIPAFNVLVIIGAQRKGIPYTAGVGAPPAMTADRFILPVADLATAKSMYGEEGDSEVTTAIKYAKAAGAGTVYVLGVRPTTPVSLGQVQNATPVVALLIDTVGKVYGAEASDITLTIAASVHTIIPPKNVTFLSANGGAADVTINVNNVRTYKTGDVVNIVSNAQGMIQRTVDSVNPTAKTITFTAVLGAAYNTADYAHIYQPAPESQEVSPALTTVTAVQNWYLTSKYLNAVPQAGIALMPTTLAKTAIGLLTGATMGTTPAVQAGDWQAVCDNFQRWNEEFAIINKAYMRILNFVTSDSGNHAAAVAMATSTRRNNKPVQIVTGCALGDYLLDTGNAANPIKRIFNLNTDEIQLAGFGGDGLAAYLSYGPWLAGLRAANAVNHNQTADILGGGVFLTVEKSFFRDDTALTPYVEGGVMAILMTKTGYKVVQGLTGFLNQSVSFDANAKKTYLVTLRDLADFHLRLIVELMEQYAGADGVTRNVISAAAVQALDVEQNQLQYINGYTIKNITKQANAWIIEEAVGLDSPTDFVGIINDLIVN